MQKLFKTPKILTKSMNLIMKRKKPMTQIPIFYLFILFILPLMLIILEQRLFITTNSKKMLIDVKTLVKNLLKMKNFI